jgi:hypothetical protein
MVRLTVKNYCHHWIQNTLFSGSLLIKLNITNTILPFLYKPESWLYILEEAYRQCFGTKYWGQFLNQSESKKMKKYFVRSLTTYIYSIITRIFTSKRIKWMRNAVHMKSTKNALKTTENLRHLERPNYTWKDAF